MRSLMSDPCPTASSGKRLSTSTIDLKAPHFPQLTQASYAVRLTFVSGQSLALHPARRLIT